MSFSSCFLKRWSSDGFASRWGDSQEDAHEMLTFLLQKLEPPIRTKPVGDNSKPLPTEIDRIFGGILKRRGELCAL